MSTATTNMDTSITSAAESNFAHFPVAFLFIFYMHALATSHHYVLFWQQLELNREK